MGLLNSEVTLCYCLLLTTLLVYNAVVGTEYVIETIEDCFEDEESRQLDVRNLSIGILETGDWGVQGTIEANFPRTFMTMYELTKCASKEEPETCTFFSTVRYKDTCKMLEAKNEFWYSFFAETVPPMKCPLKGFYSFEKSKIDMATAKKGLPGLDGFYWKVKTTALIGKKKLGCFRAGVSMI